MGKRRVTSVLSLLGAYYRTSEGQCGVACIVQCGIGTRCRPPPAGSCRLCWRRQHSVLQRVLQQSAGAAGTGCRTLVLSDLTGASHHLLPCCHLLGTRTHHVLALLGWVTSSLIPPGELPRLLAKAVPSVPRPRQVWCLGTAAHSLVAAAASSWPHGLRIPRPRPLIQLPQGCPQAPLVQRQQWRSSRGRWTG